MSISERETGDAASDDSAALVPTTLEPASLDLAEPEGPPRWPAASSRPSGSHHAYPAPYPAPWGAGGGRDSGHDAVDDGEAPSSGPSTGVIAICLGVGVSLFALGVALMTIVI